MAQVLKDEVKDKIKQSAVDMFTQKGYINASIKEIAANAGVSVGNVYRYYKNKSVLYKAVIQSVYDGVQEIMNAIELNKQYRFLLDGKGGNENIFYPMKQFIQLYRKEHKVFRMLLNGQRDQHYEETIIQFLEMLKGYFSRFWGVSNYPGGLSDIEVSALANAIIFAVIDILNHVDDNEANNIEVEEQLMAFAPNLIRGVFYAKSNMEGLT